MDGFGPEDRYERELGSFFQEYRAAFPDPEPSAGFMPGLWNRIDARRSFTLRLRRLSQVGAFAAVVSCLVIALLGPSPNRNAKLSGNYVDVLAEAQTHPDDNIGTYGLRLDPEER